MGDDIVYALMKISGVLYNPVLWSGNPTNIIIRK